MSDVTVEVSHVWKRFHRGEIHDSLRDLVPALAKRLVGRGRKRHELGEGDFWALRDVNFQVKRGEVLGIIGSNGAGKSTLLKILARILRPNRGSVRVNGRLRALIEIAAGFHQDLTGRENIYLNGTILGMKRREIDAKFDEIVDFSGIEPFLDTPVKRYSSGMYARLGFAVAAHLEPEILIVDEVLAVGDVAFQKKCLGKMGDVSRQGQTVLLVSHNMAAVKALARRCCWLDGGALRACGPVDDVVSQYVQEYERKDPTASASTLRADRGQGVLTNSGPNGLIRVRCGDPIVLDFTVETPAAIDSASVGVSVLKAESTPVVTMSSAVQNVSSRPGPANTWRVRCDMGPLPLNAGTYSTRVYLSDAHGEVARFSNAQVITVIEHDVFGWGSSVPSAGHWGPLYWAPEWEIGPVSPQVNTGS